ncbi:MAG TPA: thiol reductant ABC exporter subunit CydC, partial [Chloroflexota bacterium]|nr:thiol reductant ABC exporter subunit CydC [Chloroflexota bacterium]
SLWERPPEGRVRAPRVPVLNGVSFEIQPGERVALVGPSGAGKSTLVDLLLDFLPPDSGRILVNGTPLSRLPAAEWREQVSWLPQTPYLFHASIETNLRLARPDATREEILEAARLAGAHEFITQLPEGYDTVVGERGERLSGGQAQRIALARAFLKDAPLLILDEAAAQLDVENEALLEESLDCIMEGRTVLLIAHRLGTARRADRVVVLAEGRVAECGPHEELRRRGGLYSRMVQAAGEGDAETGRHRDTGTRGHGDTGGPHPPFGRPLPEGEGRGEGTQHSAPSTQHSSLHTQNSEPRTQNPEPRTLAGLLGLLRPLWGWMALSALLGFCTVAAGVGLMATAAFLIASAALHPSVADLAVPIVGVRFFGLSRGVFRYLERYCSHYATFTLLARLRVSCYRALEPLAPAGLMGQRGGDLLSRVVADVETLQNLYLRVVAPPVTALLVVAAMVIFLGAFAPVLILPLIATALAAGLGVPLLSGLASRGLGAGSTLLRSELNVQLLDGLQGMADLVVFGRDRHQLKLVTHTNRQLAAVQRQATVVSGLQSGLLSLLDGLGMWGVLAIALSLVAAGRLDGVYLPVVGLATLACFEVLAPLPLAAQQIEGSLAAGRRLLEIASAEKMEPQATANWDHHSLTPSLSIRDLTFSYRQGQPPALDGVNLQLEPGRSLAIVGRSGAGKSTLLHLLLRFWDYEEGSVLLGGRELREIPPEESRRLMAVVPQRTHLFNLTIRENLMLARPNATEQQMVEAARQARLHDFVASLPLGYDTFVGEQGIRLSAGERRRIAIARALLKDAPILLLDEPTAGLDSLTEKEVMDTLRGVMAGRTTLLVTHRLVGLQEMGEILLFQNGRVVERGTQQQLLSQDGHYRRSWELQRQLLPQE